MKIPDWIWKHIDKCNILTGGWPQRTGMAKTTWTGEERRILKERRKNVRIGGRRKTDYFQGYK